MALVEKMVQRFPALEAAALTDGNRSFLKDFLRLNVNHIYQLNLLTLHRHIPSGKRLYNFDIMLRDTAPELYNSAGDYVTSVARIRFKPVKIWREKKWLRLKSMQWLYTLAEFKANLTRLLHILIKNH